MGRRAVARAVLLAPVLAVGAAFWGCAASTADAKAPTLGAYLGGEGTAEPPTARCTVAGGVLRCGVYATGTHRCPRANQRLAVALGRRGAVRFKTRCTTAPRPASPARQGRRLSSSGFTCRVALQGRGIASSVVLECSSPSGNGFASDGAVIETLTPALTARGGRLIRIDRGVGPIDLGQTEEQVRRQLPPPTTASSFVWDSTGQPGVALTFRQLSGDLVVELGSDRVVSIRTGSPRFRTAAGVGVQSPLSAAARLPGFAPEACTDGYSNDPGNGPATTAFAGGGFADEITSVRISSRGWVGC